MAVTAGARLGPYEILAPLGAGAMGEVYLAEDTRLERQVAIKLLPAALTQDAARVRRFEQEARAASALNHPNIVTIHEIGEAEAGRYIVMEFIRGRTLRALLSQRPALETTIAWGKQIARALGVAHAAGIVHRDIKPENIMVRDDGYVKVLDFGLARLAPTSVESEADTLQRTNPGSLLGTASYMSPEQARSETVTSAGDIFSLGIVFYELATGQRPFRANSLLGMLQAITTETPLAPSRLNPEMPAPLESLILQMLEKDAGLRPSAVEAAAALKEIRRARERGSGGAGEWESGRAEETKSVSRSPTPPLSPTPRHTVGREKERAELRVAFDSANAGRGLLVCVAGEPGIGKTSLVEDFLSELGEYGQDCLLARGRCSERLAGTEGYLPWLEALGHLLRGGDVSLQARTMQFGAPSIPETMRRIAPTWYAQIAPFSMGESSAAQLAAERAASQERMKRELVEFVEEVSRTQPLALFFDDLHWADASTIDLIGYLASRFAGLRVLIVATYRPSDLLLAKHPFLQLKPELQSHGLCREIALEFLSREEVEKYLALEFPEHKFPAELPELIYSKTEGNPLFMADLVRYLRDRGVIALEDCGQDARAPITPITPRWTLAGSLDDIERDLPESVRGMIERKIAQISEEDRRLLTAASVQGSQFDSAVMIKALAADAAEVEERLEDLERIHGLVRLISEKELPDHTLNLRYRFVHVLYQNALYAQLRPTRRAALSAAVAEALRGFYGKQTAAVSSRLARLYEAARDWLRAAEFFLAAARNALRGFANQESIALARRGLAMLERAPDSPERAKFEIRLHTTLGLSQMMVKGYAASEVLETHVRALELCRRHGEREQLFQALFGLSIVRVVRAEYEPACALAEQCLQLAQNAPSPQSDEDTELLVQAHWVVGLSTQYIGELVAAREHFEQTIALYDQPRHGQQISLYGAILNRAHLGRLLVFLGFADKGRELLLEAIAIAEKSPSPLGLCNTLSIAAGVEVLHGRTQRVREMAETILALSDEHGLPHYRASGQCFGGWALARQGQPEEGVEMIRAGLVAHREAGTGLQRTYYLALLAEALGQTGRSEEALAAIDEAADEMQRTAERFYEAELHRLKGEIVFNCGLRIADCGLEAPSAPPNPQSPIRDPQSEAEECFHRAMEVARRQSAKAFELRAALSLARSWRRQGRQAEARALLAESYDWFTEGFDTVALKAAKALLDEMD
jgi:serine/threonine protein kinase/predicted ATPase